MFSFGRGAALKTPGHSFFLSDKNCSARVHQEPLNLLTEIITFAFFSQQ